jgi:hypothetical protein
MKLSHRLWILSGLALSSCGPVGLENGPQKAWNDYYKQSFILCNDSLFFAYRWRMSDDESLETRILQVKRAAVKTTVQAAILNDADRANGIRWLGGVRLDVEHGALYRVACIQGTRCATNAKWGDWGQGPLPVSGVYIENRDGVWKVTEAQAMSRPLAPVSCGDLEKRGLL